MTEPGLTFNQVAEDYDRYRAVYPTEFIKMVLEVLPSQNPSKLCEIGCGTGQATIRLADLGHTITCVDPGDNLLKIARKRLEDYCNVSFVHSKFETAELPSEAFDIVFAAQSLHWVSAEIRYQKIFEILRPGGSFIAVWRWNHPLFGLLGEKINNLIAENDPTFVPETRPEYEHSAVSNFNDMANSKLFWRCQIRRIPYGWEKPAEMYVNGIRTWSQLAALPEHTRADICDRIKKEIDAAGGSIFEEGETVIISGQRP